MPIMSVPAEREGVFNFIDIIHQMICKEVHNRSRRKELLRLMVVETSSCGKMHPQGCTRKAEADEFLSADELLRTQPSEQQTVRRIARFVGGPEEAKPASLSNCQSNRSHG
jgi:hypothetical protein